MSDAVPALRRFSRFYTHRLGLLGEGLLGSSLSLTESRVLYELSHAAQPAAADLARSLELDPGYLSRILRRFETRGLVRRSAHADDARRSVLTLTAKGRRLFDTIDAASDAQAAALLAHLDPAGRERLCAALADVQRLLAPAAPAAADARAAARPGGVVLRGLQPGDLGWIVHRQAVLYAQEYGWDASFEALLAQIGARFVTRLDPVRERAWVAVDSEEGAPVLGAVFVVRKSPRVAQLRMLYVEPAARGRGLGARLVDECIGFARATGYRSLMLWTNDVLHAARRLYESRGFVRVKQERHRSFGHALVGETWTLAL
jgi:DNA-binding MarR family transcriptional regulator/predicted GNAT family acetyltransferase